MKYMIFRTFRALLFPLSEISRKKRMKDFAKTMTLFKYMRVLDLGGQPMIWDHIKIPLNITCLNLPGKAKKEYPTHHIITYAEGNACNMPQYSPGDFDLIFSNSVIEHVGDECNRALFAEEIKRLAAPYWIQTPFKWFPIEAHCGMLFWWFYPQFMRNFFLNQWHKILPGWTRMVRNTDIVSVSELKRLLHGCNIKYERAILFFPKSIIAYSAAIA